MCRGNVGLHIVRLCVTFVISQNKHWFFYCHTSHSFKAALQKLMMLMINTLTPTELDLSDSYHLKCIIIQLSHKWNFTFIPQNYFYIETSTVTPGGLCSCDIVFSLLCGWFLMFSWSVCKLWLAERYFFKSFFRERLTSRATLIVFSIPINKTYLKYVKLK